MLSNDSVNIKVSSQSGQALVIGAAFAFVLAVFAFMLYANSRNIFDRTELVNTADAAAYSAGVAVSRELNFLALSNRAIIANHVTVGHLTSYKSWSNNIADAGVQAGDGIRNVLDGLGLSGLAGVGDVIGGGFRLYDDAVGLTTSLHIALQQQLISSQRAAQGLAVEQLTGIGEAGNYYINVLMKGVAEHQDNGMSANDGTYMESHSDYSVNAVEVIESLKASSGSESDELMDVYNNVANQYNVFSSILTKKEVAEVGDTDGDGGQMQRLVEHSYTSIDSSEWFTGRNWSVWEGSVSKTGETNHKVVEGKLDWAAWDATDIDFDLKLGPIKIDILDVETAGEASASDLCENIEDYFVAPFTTLAEGLNFAAFGVDVTGIEETITSAMEDSCTYEGISDYYQLSDEFIGLDGGNGSGEISLAAVVSKTMSHMAQGSGKGIYLDDLSDRPAASAVAISGVKITHEPPPCIDENCSVGFSDGDDTEYANIFNPFWQAKLADPTTLF